MVVIITLNKTKPPKEKVGGFPVKKKRRWRIKTKYPEDNKQKRIQCRPLSASNYSEYLAYYRCVPLANHRPTHSDRNACRTSASDSVDTVKSYSNTMQLHPTSRQTTTTRHNNYFGVAGAARTVRRRFSTELARKLSTTIGWRGFNIPVHEIVSEGKSLCGQYIKYRLLRSGVYNRKSVLQSLTTLSVDDVICDVFAQVLSLGQELERMYPLLYIGVARQVGLYSGSGALATDKTVNDVMAVVGREMFRTDITWAKVVSLFAVAGGLAVDCVRQGRPEYLQCVVDSTGEVLEYEVASWIAVNGGWSGLLTYCKPATNEISPVGFVALLSAVMATALFLVLLLRWFSKFFCV